MNNHDVSRRKFLLGSAAAAGGAALGTSALTATRAAASPLAQKLPDVDKPGRTPNTVFAVNLEMWFRGAFAERIDKAAELGYPVVEFWPYANKDLPAMVKRLKHHEMTVSQFTAWGFGTELNNPAAGSERFVSTIQESCVVAGRLPGCELFTVVLGNNIKGLKKEEMHAAAVEKIKRVVPILEKHKKTIIIEPMNPYNHPGHCLYGSRDGIAICKAVGSEYVKLNWDLFHMQRYEGNLIYNLRKGIDYVGYFQLADSPDRNEPLTGEINYTEVFKAIKDVGYERPVGLECVPKGGDTRTAARRIYAADTWR